MRFALIAAICILTPVLALEAWGDCMNYRDYLPTIGSVDTPGSAYRIAVSGTLAYVADVSSGLQVIDISNPASPTILGSVDTPGNALGIAVSGTVAYVADDSSGLQLIDVSNPSSPAIIGSVDTPGQASGVAVSGTLAYVGDWESGLQVIDVSNPAFPSILGSVDTPGQAWGVAVSGALAYLADYEGGFTAIDVSNPSSPKLLDSVSTPFYPVGVVLSGTLAYVTDEAVLQVIDISNPNHLSLLGSVSIPGATLWSVALSGTLAYVAAGEGGVQVIDVSNPASPQLVGGRAIPGQALDIVISGTQAYVADYLLGLQVIDVSNPASPVIGKSGWLSEEIHGISASGSIVYVADGGAGLRLIDVSNPVYPRFLGSVDTPGYAAAVAVSGTWAYVADTESGLQVVDVSDLDHPVIVGSVDTPGQASSVALYGTTAYVADGLSGVQKIDVSNPAAPALLGGVGYYQIHASDVAISGTVAYVTDTHSCPDVKICGLPHFPGLAVIDINPANPPYSTGRLTPGTPYVVTVSGTFAYVADGSLNVFDISSPLSPVLRATINTQTSPTDVAISGMVAYVTHYAGLELIDVSSPTAPVSLGGLFMHNARGVAFSTSSVCLAVDNRLLTLPFQCDIPTPVLLSSFTASLQGQGILLEWRTSSQVDFSGFHVQRSMQSDAGYERITSELIRPKANYKFLDSDVVAGATYYYRLEALDRTGRQEFFGPVSARMESRTPKTQLGQAFPNPLHEASTIPFTLASPGHVRIRVLDLAGREVDLLLDAVAEAGERSVIWNGRNERGEPVPAGMYLYELQAPGFEATRKLVRLP